MIILTGILVHWIWCILIFIFKIGIGFWVYFDSKNKNLNPVFWTLVSIIIPFFIGFLIYLFIARNFNNSTYSLSTFDKSDPNIIYEEDILANKDNGVKKGKDYIIKIGIVVLAAIFLIIGFLTKTIFYVLTFIVSLFR